MKLKFALVCLVIFTAHIVCNGERDCKNGKGNGRCNNGTMVTSPRSINSTPHNNGTACRLGWFTCKNQKCVPDTWRCDSNDDCGDNSDEIGCGDNSTLPASFSCQGNEFKCLSNFCIPRSRVCDRKDDCEGGEDELNCANNPCPHNKFFCGPPNYNCINSSWVCDGQRDCNGGKDEENCNGTMKPPPRTVKSSPGNTGTVCPNGTFTCNNQICIPEMWKCDDKNDCAGGEDELDCANNSCLHYEFSCGPPNYYCIHSLWVCDGELDCQDGRDEKNCNGTMAPPPRTVNSTLGENGTACRLGWFTCKNQKCVPKTWRCDGNDDCGDNSDEIGCGDNSTVSAPLFSCQGNEFKCLSNSCIPRSRVCDRKDDCEGGEDELNCANNPCPHNKFFFGPPNYNCINSSWVCDGQRDCNGGKDEENCNGTMTPLPRSVKSSPGNKGTACRVGWLTCKNQKCVPETWRCDDNDDCGDNSDEIGCGDNSTHSATFSCQDNEFKCLSNFCIPRSRVCDRKDDCTGGEDEQNCMA